MKYLLLPLILLGFFLCYAQQNPFRTPPQSDSTKKISDAKPKRHHVPINSILWKKIPFSRNILSLQSELSGKLSQSLRKIKERPHPTAVIVLLLIAFLYGILHSLGPGHAKALFISHGLTRATPLCSTWIAGVIFSVTHTGVAVILFVVLRKVLGLGQAESEFYSARFITLSGILIMVAGAIIILSTFLENAAHSLAGSLLSRSSHLAFVAILALPSAGKHG